MSNQGGPWRRKPVDEFQSRKETPWPLGATLEDEMGQNLRVGARRRLDDPKGLMVHHTPETDTQALMEAAPGNQPAESQDAQSLLADQLADALELMSTLVDEDGPRLLHVFQAHLNRGMSFTEIAAELSISKTHAHYLYQMAQAMLQAILMDGDYTAVHERLR